MSKFNSKPYSNFKASGTSFEYLRFAEVTRIDYFKMEVDIRYLDADNFVTRVPFLSPGFSPGGFMGGMPEVGAMAVVGYTRQTNNSGYPIILGFLPRNLQFSYDFEPFNLRDNIEDTFASLYLRRRLKGWKLYPGEFLISSIDGSDVRVDKAIFLQNAAMNEVYLDPYSQVMSFLSLNQTFNSRAGRMNFGLIHRNDLIYSKEFQEQFGPAAQFLPDGRLFYRVTNAPKSPNNQYGTDSLDTPGVLGYTEFRIDMREVADDTLDVVEESTGAMIDRTTTASQSATDPNATLPIVTFAVGTLVGNDSVTAEGKKRYGKILMPVTFANNLSTDVLGNEQPVVNTNGVNGERTQAAAFHVKIPNRKTQFSFTKEGVMELALDKSSSGHQLGAGRSANIGMEGSLKMALGKQADGRSLLLDLLGGAAINIGGGNEEKNLSLDMTIQSGVNFEILGASTDKNSLRGRIRSNVDLFIEGNRYTEIKGDDIYLIHGKLEHQVLGKKVDNFINDKSNNFGGSLKENVTATYQSNIGQGRKVTVAAPDLLSGSTDADKLKIILGNKVTEMLLGNHETKLLAGKIKEEILLGERTCDIGVGNFKVSTKVGNINLETLVGNVSISTLAGNMSFKALQIQMKALQIQMDAPLVKIGSLPQGGVVNNGPAGHKDYLTGLPLLGSATVTCNTI